MRSRALRLQIWVASATLAAIGCASPGPPLPPTLNLPQIPAAGSLSAVRTGPTVTVRWATPERTTDKLPVRGTVTAELCREVVSLIDEGAAQAGASPARSSAENRPCTSVVASVSAKPDAAGEAIDNLPAPLVSGPPRLLAYRVQLKNAAGRTAGASASVFAAAGDAPAPPANFRAHAGKAGAVLEWTPEPGQSANAIELQRAIIDAPTASPKKTSNAASMLSTPETPAVITLRAGDSGTDDAGGTIDRSVEIGHTYAYTAWRVRAVEIRGQKLEIRSAVSPAVMVPVTDTFAPDAPSDLVAVPAFAGEGNAARPALDLSWQPNNEPRVAGYRVYRRDADDPSAAWQIISGAQLLTVPAYRDAQVTAGRRYAYRVTAIGLNGMESPRSEEAAETAPTP